MAKEIALPIEERRSASLVFGQPGLRDTLIAREQEVIRKAKEMEEAESKVGFAWRFGLVLSQARGRLRALKAGLLPIRISGRYFPVAALLREGQMLPVEGLWQAEEAQRRIPGGEAVVYGWDREALPERRRQLDPVLAYHYSGSTYFLGFWQELDVPDADVNPEFFGIMAPWVEAKRGRPAKSLKG